MPTPKQVRFHYGRIGKLRAELQAALTAAHHAGVIEYDDYTKQSPCKTLFDTWERIKRTTEKALATAYREEIRRGEG